MIFRTARLALDLISAKVSQKSR